MRPAHSCFCSYVNVVQTCMALCGVAMRGQSQSVSNGTWSDQDMTYSGSWEHSVTVGSCLVYCSQTVNAFQFTGFSHALSCLVRQIPQHDHDTTLKILCHSNWSVVSDVKLCICLWARVNLEICFLICRRDGHSNKVEHVCECLYRDFCT